MKPAASCSLQGKRKTQQQCARLHTRHTHNTETAQPLKVNNI